MKKKEQDISRSDSDLGSYFDGELSKVEAEHFGERLEGDSNLREELHAYQQVREELQAYVSDGAADAKGNPRNVDLWSRVAADISHEKTPSLSLLARLTAIIGLSGSGEPRKYIGLPQFGGALAAVAVLLVFLNSGQNLDSVPSSSGVATELASQMGTGREPVSISVPLTPLESPTQSITSGRNPSALSSGSQSDIPLVRMTGSRPTRSRRQLLLSSPRVRNQGNGPSSPFERSVELELGNEQWIGSESMPGGLRTGGLEIDWIKTDRPFRILNRPGQDAPVIWIGNREIEE